MTAPLRELAELPRSAVAGDRPGARGRARRGADQRPGAGRPRAPARQRPASRTAPPRPTSWRMTCWRAGPTAAWITCSPSCRARGRCAGSRVGSCSATWSGTSNKGRCAASTPRQGATPPSRRARSPTRRPSGGFVVPARLAATAVGMFPTFEAYMDATLHHPAWGYDAHAVSIGRAGHFNTPTRRALSPRYGGSAIAERAFRCWQDMISHRGVSPRPMRSRSSSSARATGGWPGTSSTRSHAMPADARSAEPRWRVFRRGCATEIYETSASLRDKQRALLGDVAVVAEGDARRPRRRWRGTFPAACGASS